MTHNKNERPFWLSKDALDTINSLAWFSMDAFWMLGFAGVCFFFAFPTIMTGLCLLYIEKRPVVFKINIALNCWILMNTLWMTSEVFKLPGLLIYAKTAFAGGILFIALAAVQSRNVRETFSHFRRFRTLLFFDRPDQP